MEDMRTSKQVLSSIETGIIKLIKQFTPEEKEIKDEEKYDKIIELLEDSNHKILGQIENLKIENKMIRMNTEMSEYSGEKLEAFNLSRLRWFLSSAVILFLLTLLFYHFKSILFLLPAGFFVANLGILMMIYYDWKLTPGDSFARISKNPIALSGLMFVIAFFFYVGISVGEKYIPDSFGNEASQRIEERLNNIERIISDQEGKKQVPETSEDDDINGGESDRIPNR